MIHQTKHALLIIREEKNEQIFVEFQKYLKDAVTLAHRDSFNASCTYKKLQMPFCPV